MSLLHRPISIVIAVVCLTVVQSHRVVINTWGGDFSNATVAAFRVLAAGRSALDAVEAGGIYCEENQCDTTVGFGNHPDTMGRTSLDAMIMDGSTFDVGSVGYVRNYHKAISIARSVMEYTGHTLLVGEGAEEFAGMVGFPKEEATTKNSKAVYDDWIQNNCQPNFYENIDAAKTSCGPYVINPNQRLSKENKQTWQANVNNHDTIGIVALDDTGLMACGTSTNGANHKVAGRVGDSPITGAGCYVDSSVGGAAATGDGDVMMRFLPSFHAVSLMEQGATPLAACTQAMARIAKIFPTFAGGIVCITKNGEYAAASNNMSFAYSVYTAGMSDVQIITVS